MSVSAKFYVLSPDPQFPARVVLQPVCRGVENRSWASATPSGRVELYITNEAARGQFVAGQEYEAIFRHVPKPTPGDGHVVEVIEQKAPYSMPDGSEKTYYVCGTCGSYASLNEDGTPDWSKHDEVFGSAK